MNKQITVEQAVSKVKDGMVVMIGGFLTNGSPNKILDALAASNVKNLTVITNDCAYSDKGLGQLFAKKQIKRFVASYIGSNELTQEQMNAGELDMILVPQGTLAERIRCGGNGLGGVLTQTGLGTLVAKDKQIINVDGKDYLLEKPLHADIALIGASKADKSGNLIYYGTSRNFNPLMAMAADMVIVETDQLVEVGTIDPNQVHTPSVLVDFIVY